MKNGIFTLTLSDWQKGLVMAVIGGFLLPIQAVIQEPAVNLFTVDWKAILVLAANGAILGFIGYLCKNFLSDNEGKVFGKIG